VENLKRYGICDETQLSRIRVVTGDLGLPDFGLGEAEFQRLSEQIDVLYSNAAHLSYVANYQELRPSHVIGTREMIRLACTTRQKVLHHVSSLAVFDSVRYRGRTMSETETPLETSGIHTAYSQCKWTSEALVRAAGERGMPVVIYRPEFISGSSVSGAWNTDDFLCRLLKGIVEMGFIPGELDIPLEFSPVDYVARSIVHLSQKPSSLGQVFHLNNPRLANIRDAAAALVDFGYRVSSSSSYAGWVDRIETQRDASLYALLPFFRLRLPGESVTYLETYQRSLRRNISCQTTVAALDGSGIVCPEIDSTLLTTYLRYLVSVGFLPPPAGG
jgi:thioester reductase-like protein